MLISLEKEPILNYFDQQTYSRSEYGQVPLQWRHNERNFVSNHQPRDCLLNSLFSRRSKKTSKLSVTWLYAGNSPVTGEFPAQRPSNAENVSIWWRHHAMVVNHFPRNISGSVRVNPLSAVYLTVREITKSSGTFSATYISSNIIWLLQLYDRIQLKPNYTWINWNHDNIAIRSHIMIHTSVKFNFWYQM